MFHKNISWRIFEMNRKLFWLIATVLMAALMLSGTVFAEGEIPVAPTEEPVAVVVAVDPQPVEPAPVIQVVEETAPADPAPIEEVIPPVVEEPIAIVEAVVADPAPVEVTTPVVEEAVSPAEPILADASGEPLNLVSQESADLISSGDPYWYVGTKKYAVVFLADPCPTGTVLLTTCWKSATPITAALARIESGLLPTNRKLYIVGGTTYVEDISIDASSGADHTKGQLNGFLGIADLLGNYPVLNGYIQLENMANGFTLSDITINDYFSIKESKGTVVVKNVKAHSTTGSGIVIGDETLGVYTRHVGNVTLNNVTSNFNLGSGAEIYTVGATTITNSAFNFNGAEGLNMNTLTGKVTLKDMSAIGNQDDNVLITKYQNSLTIKNAVLNASQTSYGLYAASTSSAPVTLDSIIANTNDEYGIYLVTRGAMTLTNVEASGSLNATGAFLYHIDDTAQIKVTNSRFLNNGLLTSGSGLVVFSKGEVLLTSITATGNMNDGLYVDNCLEIVGECHGSGNVTITSPAGGGLMSANYFVDNGNDGVEIYSKGIVSLYNFIGNDNSGYGVYIENRLGTNGISINKTIPYWTNTANHNSSDGIYLWSKGVINVANTSASYNSGVGLYAGTSPLYVLISSGEFNNNSSGLYITSYNPITINSVAANGNTAYGMYLVVNASKTVGIIKGIADNNGSGIYVSTFGSTVFKRVTANGNTGYGARVEGCLAGTCTSPANFILTSNVGNYFNDNGTIGLSVATYGGISITNVSAISNGSLGLLLDNEYTGIANGVSITNNSNHKFTENTVGGMAIYTNGAITLSRVDSSSNTGFGAWLDNSSAITAKALTLNDCTFDNNGNTGLDTDIHGPIYVYGVRASGNTGTGADLNNTDGAVVITSSSRMSHFIDNTGNGLDITSTGAVTLNNIVAELNGLDGVNVTSDSNVTVSGTHSATATSFSDNISDGLVILADGTITIKNTVLANGNGSNGIYLYNQTAASGKKISVSNSETNDNGNKGVWIRGNSIVTILSIDSQSNSDDGLYIENNSGTSGIVTISGTNLLSNNGSDGLELHTPLAASVSGVMANSNTNSGIYITSALGTTKVTNCSTRQNLMNGIELDVQNNSVISGVKSFGNGTTVTHGDGLWIDSNGFNVTIKSSSFIGNFGNGIDAQLGVGVLSLSSTVYVGNDADGTGLYDDLYVH
jgi:putative surface-exposed virulence protein